MQLLGRTNKERFIRARNALKSAMDALEMEIRTVRLALPISLRLEATLERRSAELSVKRLRERFLDLQQQRLLGARSARGRFTLVKLARMPLVEMDTM